MGFKADYERDGVVVVKNCLRPEPLSEGWAKLKTRIAVGDLVREDRFVSGDLHPLECLPGNLMITDLVKSILGTQDVALYFYRLLLKDAAWWGEVALHQDMPYFHGGLQKVSVFVPLVPVYGRNGGLVFVKGSHKYGNLNRGTIDRSKFEPMDDLAPDLEVGDIVLMDFLTWHYSEKTKGPMPERPLMQITYQPATDGSFCGAPELISGKWQTQYFSPSDCTQIDS